MLWRGNIAPARSPGEAPRNIIKVAMKPRTGISSWLAAGPLILSLSAALVLSSQARGSQVARAVLFPASIVGPSAALATCCQRVKGPELSRAESARAAPTPLSDKIPARTTSQQRAPLCFASESPVSIGDGPSRGVPVAAHLRTKGGQSIAFSLQAQHVRIQI